MIIGRFGPNIARVILDMQTHPPGGQIIGITAWFCDMISGDTVDMISGDTVFR